jgi:membrane associated rhomboid family serine protease
MERYPLCNFGVIAVTCWVSYLGFRDAAFRAKYVFWPEAILARREYYRLVTSGFLHLDGGHLLMNMLSLYFFGPMLERVFGPAQFLAIYLGAMLGGDLLALYVHRHQDYRALGASGGVAGIIFAYILLFPGGHIGMYFLPIGIPSWLYAIGFLLASFYGMHRNLGNIGHDAHLGGALVGLFLAAAFHPMAIRYNPWLFGVISSGTALLFLYMARNPLFLPLEGADFTKENADRTNPSRRFSWRRLFNFTAGRNQSRQRMSIRSERQVDAILQKISERGLESVTEEEKQLLKEISSKYRRRGIREKPKSGFPL